MDNKVATVAATPDPTFGKKPPPQRPDVVDAKEGIAPTPDPADLRLVIEEDKASGTYVYKTVDRSTGKVVLQLPREQVLRLRDELAYEAGTVVSTKA